MNYLEAFLRKKRRAENCEAPTDKTDITGSVSFVSETPACSSASSPRGSVPKTPISPPSPAVKPAENSRDRSVPATVRALIEEIEADARSKGWPADLLWNSHFWDTPRGLAALLDEGDAIAEVTTDYIAIFKVKHTIQRFQRRIS
jgi:hypothetical protein